MDRLIYKATCLVNNKIYIGQTKDLKERKRTHLKEAIKKKTNMIFHKAINKYGIDNFIWEILYTGEEDIIDAVEVYFIYYFNSHYKNGYGYNMSFGKSNKGYKHTEEFKLKQSIRFKGNRYSAGRKMSPENREKLSALRLGKKQSQELVDKRAKARVDKTIYTFIKEGLIFEGTMYDFTNLYLLDRSSVTKLVKNKNKKHKGWELVQNNWV